MSGFAYDMFFLKELSLQAHCRSFMLATRLAIPEHVVEQLSFASENMFFAKIDERTDPSFDSDRYIAESKYMPEFLSMVIKESTTKLLLDNIVLSLDFMKLRRNSVRR